MSEAIIDPAVKPEVIIPDSKATLRRIGFGVIIAVGVATAQILAEVFPATIGVLKTMLPGWLAILAPFLDPIALSVQAWLLQKSKQYHKDSVIEALQIEPPPSAEKKLSKYY